MPDEIRSEIVNNGRSHDLQISDLVTVTQKKECTRDDDRVNFPNIVSRRIREKESIF